MKKVKRLLKALKNEDGVAIVMAVSLMFLLATLGVVLATQVYQEVQLANENLEYVQSLYLAESAIERGFAEIMQDINWIQNVGIITDAPICGSDSQSSYGSDQGLYSLQIQVLSTNPTLPGNPPKHIKMTARGSYEGAIRDIVVETDLVIEDVSIWNNAIFAGAGAPGGVIEGNSSIHGSLHLLGDNLTNGGTAVAVVDLSGASVIHNTYDGMSAGLLAHVPALPTADFGGETVGSLDAKLRVKNGVVSMSGNAEIGSPDTTGNSVKETIDGTYVTDGWTGNSVNDDGGRGDPTHVYSDNGYDSLYDLGNLNLTIPSLSDTYTDPSTGTNYATYDSYLSDTSLHIPSIVLDNTTSGATTIANSVTSGQLATMNPSGATATYDTITGKFTISNAYGKIEWDPVPAGSVKLEVSGIVYVQGNLTLGSKTLQSSRGGIKSVGNGSMYAAGTGVIDIHSDIIANGIFPTDDVLGLMAKDRVEIATGPGDAQVMITAAVYAENKIISKKQNQIAGTFVSNYFDMSTNVPNIYQVPALNANMPFGMIASEHIYVVTGFDMKSWRVE